MTRVLILGGTTEASRLAVAVKAAGLDAVFSYAGRTVAPVRQPLPTRIGGFGGVAGLCRYLRDEAITHVVDATHPFAVEISANAAAACAGCGVPLLALERTPWQAGPGDRWRGVPDLAHAVAALPIPPTRIFLAIGNQHLAAFAHAPQHHYLVRLVDPPQHPLPLARVEIVIARGPFDIDGDCALMQRHGTQLVIARNSGGAGADAKLVAARRLGLPVVLIERPQMPPRRRAETVEEVMDWLADTHRAPLGV
ncbi:MAG: cobalt-precorrin-6A reductase [Hyphomicrobiaceae bacterium]|nr:cobalt-precorrin-6A reductase [Hyphomicrobiaceae bacterium]